MNITEWCEKLKERFDERELDMDVRKGLIQIQLKDKETEEIHLHNIEYVAKDAENLEIAGRR